MKHGLLVLCWLGPVGLAYAQPANPVKATIRETATGTEVVLENNSTVVLTAVAFSSIGPERNEVTPTYFDSAVQRWKEVQPGSRAKIAFGGRFRSAKIEFKAAILADGGTFGDSASIEAMLATRRATLEALGIILQHLPASVDATTSPTELLQRFRSCRREQLAGLQVNDPVQIAIINVNLIIERKLKTMMGEPSDSAMTAITALLRDWRAALSGSLPSLGAVR